MKLASIRTAVRMVKRLADLFRAPPPPPPASVAPVVDLGSEAWAVLATLHAQPNDTCARGRYQALRHRLCQSLLNGDNQSVRRLATDEAFHIFITPLYKD